MKLLRAIANRIRHLFKTKSPIESTHDQDCHMLLILEAAPLSISLWSENCTIIDCNEASVKLFHLSDKEEFKDGFLNLSPRFQPCGRASCELARAYVKQAFKDGSHHFEWMHMTADGIQIPCDVTLIRIEFKGNPVVAAYLRDLSEIKKTFNAMRKAEDDLRMALTVAEESAKMKSDFLDNMNHELRTPMNGILGFLRMASQARTMVELRKYISEAEQSAKGLLRIVSDVLDFTEIERHKLKVNAEIFNISDIFDEMHDSFSSAADSKGLELIMRQPSDMPDQVIGDLLKLKRILSILIDNAIKFTAKGKITVRASIKKHTEQHVLICFYVRDTGIGLTPEQMESLFVPFWHADTSVTEEYGGTGFGLALSKHLAILLGGKIWAESEYEEGTTFYFTAHFVLPGALDFATERILSAKALEEQELDTEAYDPNNTHLLVVDDVRINQVIAKELLTGKGYSVDIANNGKEALAMLDAKKYDAILMDIQMPVMNGFEATEKIREDDKHKDLPIIAVSAHALTEDKEKSLAYGMNDHIAKPIDLEMLIATLNKWLKPARSAQA